MMENHQIYHHSPVPGSRGRGRGRGQGQGQGRGKGRGGGEGGGLHRNRQWVAPSAGSSPGPGLGSGRGGVNGLSRGGSSGRGGRNENPNSQSGRMVPGEVVPIPGLPPAPRPEDEPFLESAEEREKFYQELVKSRELERKHYISLGLMDDPLVPKRLSDAITMVGTCHDLCPRFERYRRERENNLQFPWETLPSPNHKRIDHTRAVKMYERAAGDKTLPSDLRPPSVLSKTLDYLFHDLVGTYGFKETFSFVRDRTRSVRNDFTMQHENGREAIECHERCARFHVVALKEMRGQEGFEVFLEEQQLMNTLQSLKEFYTDPLNTPSPSLTPNQLEFRVYHRLIHIRDQKERHDDVPKEILDHPIFRLVTRFRNAVQKTSLPITKSSKLRVDEEGMKIFGELVGVLMQGGDGVQSQDGESIKPSPVMPYLIACILQHLFGSETIDESEMDGMRRRIGVEEGVRGVVEVIDGGFGSGGIDGNDGIHGEGDDEMQEGGEIVDDKMGEGMEGEEQDHEGEEEEYYDDREQEQDQLYEESVTASYPQPLVSAFSAPTSIPQSQSSAFSAFSTAPITGLAPAPTQIGGPKASAFSNLTTASTNPFGTPAFGSFGATSTSPFETRVFGQPIPVSTSESSSASPPFGQPQSQPNPSQSPFNPFSQLAPPSHPTTRPYRPPPFDQGLSANVASPFGVSSPKPNHSAPEVPLIFDPRGGIGEGQGRGQGLTSGVQDGAGKAPRQAASEQGAGQGQGAASAFSQPSTFAQPPPKSAAKERIFSSPLTLPTSSSSITPSFGLGTNVSGALNPHADSFLPGSGPDLEKGDRSLADAPPLGSIPRSTSNPLFPSSSSSSPATATKPPPPPTLSIPTSTPSPSQSNQSSIGHALPPPTPGAPRHVPIALPPATPTVTTSFSGFNVSGRFPTPQSEPLLAPAASASASGSGLPASISASTSLSAIPQPPDKRLTLLKTSNLPLFSSTSEGGAGTGVLSPLQLNSPSLSRMGSLKTFGSISSLGSMGSLSGVSASPNLSPLVNGLRSGTGIQPQGVNGNTNGKGKVEQKASFSATTDEFEITDDDKEDGGSQTEPEDDTEGTDRAGDGVRKEAEAEDESQKSERLYEEAVARGEMYQSQLRRRFKKAKGKERQREVDGYDEDEYEGEFLESEPSYSTRKKRPRVGHTHSPSPYRRLLLNATTTHAHTLSRSSNARRKPRQRPRLSGEIGLGAGVRTDEELARRLSENQASHRHRWAPGSFLAVWRGFVLRGPGGGTSAATTVTTSTSFPSSSISANTATSTSLFPSSQSFSFPSSNSNTSSTTAFSFPTSTSFPSFSSSFPSSASNSNPAFSSSLSLSLDNSPSSFSVNTPIILPSNSASVTSLSSSASPLPQGLQKSYTLWLSLNPSSDATAIWVQTKFGVPESGWWRNSQCHQGDDESGKEEESGVGGEGIFEVPLMVPSTPSALGDEYSAATYSRGGPGIIVFECTPLDGVDDVLERKYHILDDCTRLREIFDILRSASSSNTRFFIPSLVFIHWAEMDGKNEEKGIPKDLIDMVNRVISPQSQPHSQREQGQCQDPLLTSYTTLSIASTTKDLDAKFKQALSELRDKDMDFEGRLGEVLELGGVFKLFHPTFDAFVSEWLANCDLSSASASSALTKVVGRGYGRGRVFGFGRGGNMNGVRFFNAPLYAQVLQVSLELINLAVELVGELLPTHARRKYGAGSSLLPLSDFPVSEVDDSESLYTASIRWLVQMITEETPSPTPTTTSQTQTTTNSIIESIVVDLQGHESMNKGFPTKRFIEQLWDLVKFDMELQSTSDFAPFPDPTQTNFIISTSLIESAEETYTDAIKPHQVSLSHFLNISLRKGVDLKHKRRSMNDIDDYETESNTSKRLRLSPGGAFSISTSRSASAVDSFALDPDHGTDSRSLFSVSVNDSHSQSQSQTSPTPTPSPDESMVSNGVGTEVNGRTGSVNALAKGHADRNGMAVSSETSDSTPAVVTLEMLRALTKSMKEKYRD